MVTGPSGQPRLPSIDERERLHCLQDGHTLGALRSSEAKQNTKLDFTVRVSMIGDGYQHLVTAWLFGNLAAQLGYLTRAPSFERSETSECTPFSCRGLRKSGLGSRCAGTAASSGSNRWSSSVPSMLTGVDEPHQR